MLMEAKERWKGRWHWRANLQAMQLRVRQRLRVASTPTFSLMRFQSTRSLVVAGAPKPFHALLSTFLTKPLNLVAAAAMAHPTPLSPHHTDSDHAAAFSENSFAIRLLQAVALPLIGNVCHAFMHGLNRTEIYCAEKLLHAVSHRPQGQPLITVSNHVASMDDPLILAAMLPPHVLFQAHRLRWTLCATDRCFTNRASSAFFQCVKVLPLARGAGVYQKGIDIAVEKLKRGDWIHIFPEGSRSRDGGKTVQAAKRGIGRLVLDAGNVPLVIPFVHSGMQEVMPIGSKFPSIKKRVVILAGDPIEMDDLVLMFREGIVSRRIIHEVIAFRVGQRLKKLKEDLDHLVTSSSRNDFNQRQGKYFYDQVNSEAGCLEAFDSRKNNKLKMNLDPKQGNNHTDVFSTWEAQSLRASFARSDEVLLPDFARANSFIFQEGIISRLKRSKNSAAFVGFAAQELWMCGNTIHGKIPSKASSRV